MLFRLSESVNNDRAKPLHYLADFGYRVLNTETYEFIGEMNPSAEITGYLLALHESYLPRWNFVRTEVGFSMRPESLLRENERILGFLSLSPGRYIVSCRLQSDASHSVELILKYKAEALSTQAEFRSLDRMANLNLMFDVGLPADEIEINIRTDAGQADVLDIKAYRLSFRYTQRIQPT